MVILAVKDLNLPWERLDKVEEIERVLLNYPKKETQIKLKHLHSSFFNPNLSFTINVLRFFIKI